MQKPEFLRILMLLSKLETFVGFRAGSTPDGLLEELSEVVSLLQAQVLKPDAVDPVKLAYDEWQEKTEWVQQTCQAGELGMHRADVLKRRIAKLEAALYPELPQSC